MNSVTVTFQEILSSQKWKGIIGVNLALGFLLWLDYLTDYSLAGTIPDILFPPIVAIVGFISLLVSKDAPSRTKRLLSRLSCLPSLIGGGLYVTVAILLFIPPFTLGTMFTITEIAGENLIQQAVSPNGSRVAEVYFRGVGAYSGGNGRIYVRVKYLLFPFVERDVYYLRVSYADENTADYLSWRDNDTLYIPEKQQEVKVGTVRTEIPAVLAIPVWLFRFLAEFEEEQRTNLVLTAPVRDVPAYPGIITHDQSQFDERRNTLFRSFNIPNHNPDEIAEWYENALNQPPWSVVRVNRHYDRIYKNLLITEYCIQAQRDEGDGQKRVYYFELMGQPDNSVHVNIGTPDPITDTCLRYSKQP